MSKASPAAVFVEAGRHPALSYLIRHKYLYLLLLPCVIYFIVFQYVPMYGIIIAFENFNFVKGITGSPWVGWDNFRYMFGLHDFYRVFWNSLCLSLLRLIFTFPVPILLALMLNEIRRIAFKRITQTMIYLPYFVSWVVVGGLIVTFLSPTWGVINIVFERLGIQPVSFLTDTAYFRPLIVLTSIWKDSGWDTIIYLAAIASINPDLYESAVMDGAGRLNRIVHITLPSIRSTIIILLILRIGQIMSNGFEQVFIFQNGANKTVSEVFETYTYSLGLLSGRFSFATTVGLFNSVIGLVLLYSAHRISRKFGEEGIW
ncbi:sugar ABC transporter permease [Paenibacillus sp. MWE-103]|uniref:Sugar ABC transporter permease n=1 Tax=Paenibacillus artemisiicola TaxID=1172618 RepID=A0ABS3W802_9BACL|nr:ABC transporter permease subunit [Paenibacillus artemisiicola]MBO7744439.1 sugar ABC transporter permease [Paenibacillus artemisiicola]